MKITIFSQFFPPEMEPSGFMFDSLASYLGNSDSVEKVEVISGFANFPNGKFLDRRFFELYRKTAKGIINYKQVYVVPSDNKTNLKRVVNYVSYMISATFSGLFSKRSDVYIATSPPIFVGLVGLIVSKIKRSKFILDVRDIWPESAIQMGSITNSKIISILEWMEVLLYKNADAIIVATPGMVDIVANKIADRQKLIRYIPCGIEMPVLSKQTRDTSILFDEDKNKFIVLYAGLHGHAQNLKVILDAARKLEMLSNIVFYFIGGGPEKELLLKYTEDQDIGNVRFLAPVDRESIRMTFQQVNCALVPLADLDVFKNVFPSKTFELWSFGIPTIVGVGGEIDTIIKTNNCSLIARPDNPEDYAEQIKMLYNDELLQKEMAENAKKTAAECFSYDSCNGNFFKVINKVLQRG